MTDSTQTQALEPVLAEVAAAINSGSITWSDLAKALVQARPSEAPALPAKLPLPAKISEAQTAALARLRDIFGSVVPTVRRVLEPRERAALMDERLVLDEVGAMVESRKDGIRTTILNHNDVSREEAHGGEPLEDALLDKDGHYLADSKDIITVPDSDRVFSWETSRREPEINLEKLRALADDPAVEGITHADWLAMTTQTRVFDEHKTMTHLKDHPELLLLIAQAAEPAAVRGALYVRKAK